MVFFDVFLFQPLIKGKYLSILWFVTFYCLEIAPKIHNNSKLSKEQETFANWAMALCMVSIQERFLIKSGL